MLRSRLLHLLLAVGLFAAQALAVAHALSHDALVDGKPTACAQCLLAHAGAALPAAPALPPSPARAMPAAGRTRSAAAAPRSRLRPPPRAPPPPKDIANP